MVFGAQLESFLAPFCPTEGESMKLQAESLLSPLRLCLGLSLKHPFCFSQRFGFQLPASCT